MNIQNLDIIDFHTHPFITKSQNLGKYVIKNTIEIEQVKELYFQFKSAKICGSVLDARTDFSSIWDKIKACNDTALELREILGEFYLPGFHVHPNFVEESLLEIERMDSLGVKIIGELCPYLFDNHEYYNEGFSVILKEAEKRNMILSIHTGDADGMDKIVKEHKNLKVVAAHPSSYDVMLRHIKRAKLSDNYYLDLSGASTFRNGLIKFALDEIGSDKIIFGSDFPICSPTMHAGAILSDNSLSENEKEQIFSINAKKLLNL